MNESYDIQELCKNAIINYYKNTYDTYLTTQDVHTVLTCKALQNQKTLMSAENLYFECTWNGNEEKLWVNIYAKQDDFYIEAKEFNTEVEDDINE